MLRFQRGCAYRGLAHKNGTGLNGEGSGFDVSYEFGVGFELNGIGDLDVAMYFTVDDNGACLDFRFDAGIFTHGE